MYTLCVCVLDFDFFCIKSITPINIVYSVSAAVSAGPVLRF
jgi:hypothetical protein